MGQPMCSTWLPIPFQSPSNKKKRHSINTTTSILIKTIPNPLLLLSLPMSSQIQMTGSKTSAAATCLFYLLISLYILVSFTDRSTGWSILNASVFLITGVFLLSAFVVVALAARATVVVWITVLVLLAFSGKRRRVLAAQGRKITAEVAMYLVKVVLKERGVAAVACVTILSFMAMSCFTNV
ncbi:uncharacterized protein LOC130767175 [Actinidia eriantha]|uniref:uncharacterized protein LOC130767175 n=1 Tax=Actinidia eriantha TaxID=165200 RepID=UPI0025897708|nr:uncharacterized protein LOC130767175 [Actinidia eriantha]